MNSLIPGPHREAPRARPLRGRGRARQQQLDRAEPRITDVRRTSVPGKLAFLVFIAAVAATAASTARPSSSAERAARPSVPKIVGPRATVSRHVTYTLRSRAKGIPASKLRFRCAVDTSALKRCATRYAVVLKVGVHTLLVQAFAPGGRRSAISRARIDIQQRSTATVQVGAAPLNAIAAGATVWTENYGDGTISAIDSATRSVRTISVGGSPGGIAYGSGSLWVSNLTGGSLTRIQPDGHIAARIAIGGAGAGVAFANGTVYVADYSGGLTRIDAATNTVVGHTVVAGHPEAVAVGFGRVWLTNQNGTVSTFNAATGAADGPPIAVGDDADDVAVATDAVWVVTLNDRRLARIDPTTRAVAFTSRTRGDASGVLAEGRIWVSNYDSGTVSVFDQTGKRLIKTYRVGTQPRGLANAGGSIWVSNQGSDSVSQLTP